jgi:hypothetical protein
MKTDIENLIKKLEGQSENCMNLYKALHFSDTGRLAYRLTSEMLNDAIADLKTIILK